MQQLDLFDYRKDYIFDRENQIAHYYDILSETRDTIIYSEHIDPKKGFSACGMDYEEYVDVKKIHLGNLTYDQILLYLNSYFFIINLIFCMTLCLGMDQKHVKKINFCQCHG